MFFVCFADFGSQDCYDIPRSFPSDKSCSFDFNESFNSYFVSVLWLFSSSLDGKLINLWSQVYSASLVPVGASGIEWQLNVNVCK